MMDYFLSFLNCSHSHPNSGIDYLGFYNEVGGIASPEWTVAMRQRMDGAQSPPQRVRYRTDRAGRFLNCCRWMAAAGFASTKFVLPDIAG